MAKTSIIKSNLIFGGAQIVQMLAIVLRAKLIAVMLGSAGMGLNAILQLVLRLVYNASICGIVQSSVREISQAYSDEDRTKLLRKIHVFRCLLTLSAILGLAVCVLGAWPLSCMSLGDASYIASFVVLGIGTMFFTLMQGEIAVLQGTRQVKALAISSIIGSFVSLAVCVPCYYFLSMKGVAVSIALANFAYWLIYLYFTRKEKNGKSSITLKQALTEGKPMITLGFVLMLDTFSVTLFSYLTNICIRLLGSINDVGLYQGAASIATQSILVVTAILSTDFYPRLSAAVNQRSEQNQIINEQFNIVVLSVSSIASIVVCLAPLIIRILLSSDFLVVAPMLKFMAVALLFRGVWIVMSYIILANGDRKAYFIFDGLLGNGLNFAIGIVAYYFGGLTGIGIANVVSSVLIAGMLFAVSYRKYHVRLSAGNKRTLSIAIALIAVSFILSITWDYFSSIGMAATMGWSLYKLNKQYHIAENIRWRFKH